MRLANRVRHLYKIRNQEIYRSRNRKSKSRIEVQIKRKLTEVRYYNRFEFILMAKNIVKQIKRM